MSSENSKINSEKKFKSAFKTCIISFSVCSTKKVSQAMAAVCLSTNLKDLKSMGYKPFVVGFIAMITVGLVSIVTMKAFAELFL